jgi:glycosyltransferase involved in cell wall biosynthesis
MRKLLGTADAIVMNTPEASARLLRAFPELRAKPVFSIPNGFDGADFERVPTDRDDGRFRILHTGYLHTATGLRLRRTRRLRRILGGSQDVDILPRSHVYLLRALEQLMRDDPVRASRVDVMLAGVTTEVDRQFADASPVSVTMPGYLPHEATVRLMCSADLLFLPMHDLPAGTRAGLVPGKTYEYLASGRPILAAVGEGDARDLLLEAGNAAICGPKDDTAMAQEIARYLRNWESGLPERRPRQEVLARYERRFLTKRLAQVFDQVLARSPRTRPHAQTMHAGDGSGSETVRIPRGSASA